MVPLNLQRIDTLLNVTIKKKIKQNKNRSLLHFNPKLTIELIQTHSINNKMLLIYISSK